MSVTSQEVLPVKPAQANSACPGIIRDLYKYLLTFAGMTVIYVGFRIYQGAFGISTGLDSTEPAFATHWMRLLYIEAIFLAIVFPTLWGYLWFTRDRNLDAITPKEEITRYFTLTMWISIYTFAVYWAGELLRGTGQFLASGLHPRHAIYGEPHHRILFQLPVLRASGRLRLALREDQIAALRQGHFASVDIGRRSVPS